MCLVNGVCVYPRQDVGQDGRVAVFPILFQCLQPVFERGFLRPGVQAGKLPFPGTHVVGDVIVWEKAVCLADAPVYQVGHGAVEAAGHGRVDCRQFVFLQRFAELHVYASFGLGESREDAVHVFAGFLDIASRLLFFV